MIEEAYVSFKTAKLLKEKGFDEICFTWYTGKGKFTIGQNNYDDYFMNHFSNMAVHADKGQCSAPTQSIAMRWLREVHYLTIVVAPVKEGYVHGIYRKTLPLTTTLECYGTYEDCVEHSIKYCLKNLI